MSAARHRHCQIASIAVTLSYVLCACFPTFRDGSMDCDTHEECPAPTYCGDLGRCVGGGTLCETDADCLEGVRCLGRCQHEYDGQMRTYPCLLNPRKCGRLYPCEEHADCPPYLPCIGLCEDEDGEMFLCEEKQEFCHSLDPQPEER